MELDKLMAVLSSGLLQVAGKPILEGMFEEWCKKITVKDAIQYVEESRSLWSQIPPNWQNQLLRYGNKMGDISFINCEWAFKSCARTNKGLASLFLNWPEAMAWLDKNIVELRENIKNAQIGPGGQSH